MPVFGPAEIHPTPPRRPRGRHRARRRGQTFRRFGPPLLADRTIVQTTSTPGGYAAYGRTLNFSAADPGHGNRFLSSGRDLLIVRNSSGSTQTVTVLAVADSYTGRVQNQSQAIAAGDEVLFGIFLADGWKRGDGYVHVDAPSADVKLAVVPIT